MRAIEAMQAVTRSGLSAHQRLVMVVMVLFANDSGLAWPSVATVAERTGLSPRTVQRTTGQLLELGALSVDAERPGRSIRYRLHPEALPPPCQPDTPVTVTPPSESHPCHSDVGGTSHSHPTPVSLTGGGVTVTPDPLINSGCDPSKDPSNTEAPEPDGERGAMTPSELHVAAALNTPAVARFWRLLTDHQAGSPAWKLNKVRDVVWLIKRLPEYVEVDLVAEFDRIDDWLSDGNRWKNPKSGIGRWLSKAAKEPSRERQRAPPGGRKVNPFAFLDDPPDDPETIDAMWTDHAEP